MGQQASRGNPYLNRTPIREPFEVAAIFTRSFPDIPSPADQEVLLPHLFEVSRVSFRRRVYVERLSGMMNATSAQSAAFTAPSEIGPQVVGDPRFHPRVLPWLRREVLAVLVPEVSNAQREQLYQIVSDILRSQRSILKVNFLSQISGFVLASRADKFWEQVIIRIDFIFIQRFKFLKKIFLFHRWCSFCSVDSPWACGIVSCSTLIIKALQLAYPTRPVQHQPQSPWSISISLAMMRIRTTVQPPHTATPIKIRTTATTVSSFSPSVEAVRPVDRPL
jgi:hypothetical protein